MACLRKERVRLDNRVAGRLKDSYNVASDAKLSHGKVTQTVNINLMTENFVQHG